MGGMSSSSLVVESDVYCEHVDTGRDYEAHPHEHYRTIHEAAAGRNVSCLKN